MFSGIHIPKFFGKKKKRISDLLKEAEELSSKELEREEILARLFKYFSEFLKKSKEEQIEEELKKGFGEKEVLISYFKKILVILRKIRWIIHHMKKSNKKILENVEELKALVEEHNKSRWNLIPLDERKFFLEFQKVCNKRYEEREAIFNLLNAVSERINNMVLVIENGLKDTEKIDYKNILEFLNSEKQIFLEVAKAELQKLGFEVKSLEDITELEDLNQVIFSRHFLDQAKYGRKITGWNKRIKRIFLIYTAVFYIGFQIVVPAVWASAGLGKMSSTEIHHKIVYQQLQQTFNPITFRSYDGIQLSGILVKNKENIQTDKVMILVHGRNYNATWLLPYVETLRKTTDNVDFLAINLRQHGPDTPKWFRSTTLGLKEAFDVVGAINDLAERGYKEVIVYGHSIGGAAVINALGNHPNLVSKEIKVKGVIVEKTFSSLEKFLVEGHKNLSANLGLNVVAPIAGAKEHFPKILPVSDVQSFIALKATESLGGFKASENNPSKAIKRVSAPVMVISNTEGDVYINPEDAKILAENAKNGILITVKSEHTTLADRHMPEFHNPGVISSMTQFINGIIK